MKDKLTITNNVAKVMAEKGITAYALAKQTGLHNQSLYSYILKPDYVPSFRTALIIAKVLDVPLEKLYNVNIKNYDEENKSES